MTTPIRCLFANALIWLDIGANRLLMWCFRPTDVAECNIEPTFPLLPDADVAVHRSCRSFRSPRLMAIAVAANQV